MRNKPAHTCERAEREREARAASVMSRGVNLKAIFTTSRASSTVGTDFSLAALFQVHAASSTRASFNATAV